MPGDDAIAGPDAGRREGTVVRVDSRKCRVDDGERIVDCRVRGVLFQREKTYSRPVAVGDRVRFTERDSVVEEVLPRRNVLARPQTGRRKIQLIAANLDQVVLVQSCAEPGPNPRLLDRFLVAVERGGYDAVIVLNKIDLVAELEVFDDLLDVYRELGYPVLKTSAEAGQGIDALRDALRDRISVFAGMSGVGKSALLTAVQPDLSLKSAEVSSATGKGRHTTTRVTLLPLEVGGYVVDTPGIREFGITGMTPAEISRCFLEFRDHVDSCRFRTCTHDHEHGCAVKAAVDEGEIDELRFDSYLRIIASLEEPGARGRSRS